MNYKLQKKAANIVEITLNYLDKDFRVFFITKHLKAILFNKMIMRGALVLYYYYYYLLIYKNEFIDKIAFLLFLIKIFGTVFESRSKTIEKIEK